MAVQEFVIGPRIAAGRERGGHCGEWIDPCGQSDLVEKTDRVVGATEQLSLRGCQVALRAAAIPTFADRTGLHLTACPLRPSLNQPRLTTLER